MDVMWCGVVKMTSKETDLLYFHSGMDMAFWRAQQRSGLLLWVMLISVITIVMKIAVSVNQT